jgi:hypothetical protein
MSWKERWTFIKPKGEEHEVEGQKLIFYPVSMSSLFTLKVIATPIAKALATIFQNENNDIGITDRTSGDGKLNGEFVTEKIIEPVSLDLATFRLQQKQSAIEEALQIIFDPINSRIIMRLIMDSLRDEFDRGRTEEQKNADADILLENIDGAQFREFLTGLFKSNKKVFGPLADMVAQSKKVINERMRDLLKQKNNQENEIEIPEVEKITG